MNRRVSFVFISVVLASVAGHAQEQAARLKSQAEQEKKDADDAAGPARDSDVQA